jgi:hypothetical protein
MTYFKSLQNSLRISSMKKCLMLISFAWFVFVFAKRDSKNASHKKKLPSCLVCPCEPTRFSRANMPSEPTRRSRRSCEYQGSSRFQLAGFWQPQVQKNWSWLFLLASDLGKAKQSERKNCLGNATIYQFFEQRPNHCTTRFSSSET